MCKSDFERYRQSTLNVSKYDFRLYYSRKIFDCVLDTILVEVRFPTQSELDSDGLSLHSVVRANGGTCTLLNACRLL
jgi:hypothetical protein